MATTTLNFDATAMNQVALIVRGKHDANDEPAYSEQHADVILPTGAPVGYYADVEDGGISGWATDPNANLAQMVIGAMKMDGQVWGYDKMKVERPHYVDGQTAETNLAWSTVLVLNVYKQQALAFQTFWANLATKPGTYSLMGKHCASRASEAFIAAGLVKTGIPGLGTPNNLYKQLVKEAPCTKTTYSGYVGFTRLGGIGNFSVTIQSI
jgi:hypothetical protein